MSIESLRAQHCAPRKGRDAGVDAGAIAKYLGELPGWTEASDGGSIAKTFKFADYFHTMAFVNAVASIAHREDHHPDLEVHYDRCVVGYSTHDVGGLSLNDFICAAKVEDVVTGNR
jgi:4a-hydroxytetrahydrobiopterin dehydratase